MTMTGIRLNVGHMHGVTPREIVGAIAGECGIPGRCIGAIDIRNDSCVVDIAGNLAHLPAAPLPPEDAASTAASSAKNRAEQPPEENCTESRRAGRSLPHGVRKAL